MYKFDEKLLRRLMIERKLNASNVARKAGLQKVTVLKLLDGRTKTARLSTIGKLADALGIEGEELIFEE